MRATLRTATILGGAAAIIVMVLLAIAAGTGAWAPAIVGAALGIVMIAGGVALSMRVVERLTTTTDRTATRVKNMELRAAELVERAAELEELANRCFEHVDVLWSDVEQMGARLGDASARLTTTESAVTDVRAELGTAGEAITQVRGGVEESEHAIVEVRSGLRDLSQEATALAARLDDSDTATTSVRKSVRNLDTALAKTTERLEPMRRNLRHLRERVPSGSLESMGSRLTELDEATMATIRSAFESGVQLDRDPKSLLTEKLAVRLFNDYLGNEEYLKLKPLIESFDLFRTQNLTTLRTLYRFYRSAGYWDLALLAVSQLHEKSGRDNDAYAVAKIQSEIDVFSQPTLVTAELPDGTAHDPEGPILHMVGRVLPETQTGYTLRTQYTALAQARKGLPVAIVGQVGITDREVEDIEHYTHQGIDYFLLPGSARNQMLLSDWLRMNMVHLAELVQRVRPSILHAQSDFFNMLIVSAVGKKYDIPTVYESRGFWEESWLSRAITSNMWANTAETMFSMYGLPAAYELRQHAEEVARLLPDHVFTLADVMKDHILESAQGGIDPDAVTIVPNAVEAANFPVQQPDRELAAEIGLPEDAVTVGYISSIVEYEGIDTLIDAFRLASMNASKPMCLLLVGDGDHLPALKNQVEQKGIDNVFFTGRVPHEDVLRYYGLIHLFVVPRKSSRVADLVTPLKPFEAFSTGRAVILSDVGALQEIADQSGAVETFRAGSEVDLSQKLTDLIEDEQRRHDLSARAARWVRSHRTWDNNASEYYRVYKQLGYAGPRNQVIETELALKERGCHPGELLRDLQETAVPSGAGWFSIEDNSQTAAEILSDGWRLPAHDPVRVDQITDWAKYGRAHRSWGFHLQAWEFMDPLISAHDESGEEGWLLDAVRIAVNWIEVHRDEPYVSDSMAWYDMSVALCTPRLIALALRAARVEAMRDDAIILAEAVTWHLDELRCDRAFNPRNNHGFYTAVSQVHAAKYLWMLPDAEAARSQGNSRLAQMAMSQFAPDGVHLEHSPEYHLMLLGSFEAALQDGLIEDEEVRTRVQRAAHVLGWMVQPDGTLVQLGDTRETLMVTPAASSTDAHTQYVLSDGTEGERPTEELAVFADGGYAFVRSPQPDGSGTLQHSGYLAFSASFHSRAHKHADDLNVVWYDRGQQILVDGGRFGYGELLAADSPLRGEGFYYASPERQYVESTMAHNTLMLDGRDHERRSRTPYGSALGACVDKGGVFDLSGRVQHTDYIHRRRVIYRPTRELHLKDSVFSHLAEERTAMLWFNIDGSFDVESTGTETVFVHPERGLRLTVTSDADVGEPVRGQEEPLRGWRSRQEQKLEPAWSLSLTFRVIERASVDTILSLGQL